MNRLSWNALDLKEKFYENFNKKVRKFFLLKLSYKNLCIKFDVFSRQNGSFIFNSKEGTVAKVLIIYYLLTL